MMGLHVGKRPSRITRKTAKHSSQGVMVQADDSQLPSFDHYQPLRAGSCEIRLFCLDPGGMDDPISGAFVTVDLENLPAHLTWNAFSYCWGQQDRSEAVQIDGHEFGVTPNLLAGLKSIRGLGGMIEPLWIDQISINQENSTERAAQVLLMGLIYSRANRVVAWLGPATESSEYLFPRIMAWESSDRDSQQDSHDQEGTVFPGHFAVALRGQTHDVEDLLKLRDVTYEHYKSLHQNTWFKRVWTVQEAALTDSLYLLAGQARVRWKEYCWFHMELTKDWGGHTHNAGTMSSSMLQVHVFHSSLYGDELKRTHNFPVILQMFNGRRATNDRDKIFGFLGLLQAPKSQEAYKEGIIRVDYKKSVEEIYTETVLAMINVRGSLEILKLCCAERQAKKYILPSWIYDWSIGFDGCEAAAGPQEMEDFKTSYRSTLDHRATFTHIPETDVLVIRGFLFDEITVLGKPKGSGNTWNVLNGWQRLTLRHSSIRTEYVYEHEQRKWIARPKHLEGGLLEAFWRTVVRDGETRSERAKSSSIQRLAEVMEATASQNEHADDWALRPTNPHRIDPYMKRQLRKVHYRTFFRTARGYLGTSCEHAQKGDKVCLLFGGRLPFLLREKERIQIPGKDGWHPSYVLIGGESYVHGLADGEGMEIAKDEGMHEHDFYLI